MEADADLPAPSKLLQQSVQKSHQEEESEESLMHGLDDLLDDQQPYTARNTPSHNLKHTFKVIMQDEHRNKKRPKPPAEDFSEDEKEDVSDDHGANHAQKRRRLKQKREKSASEVNSIDISDDMEVETTPEPPHSPKEDKAKNLALSLFADDEMEEEEEDNGRVVIIPESVSHLALSTSADPREMLQIIPKKVVEENDYDPLRPPAEKPLKIVMSHSIPIEFDQYDTAQVRCVFAANPTNDGWSPIDVEALDESSRNFKYLSTVKLDEHTIQSAMWGVFTVYGGGDNDQTVRRRSKVMFDEFDEVKKMAQVPWFILLGNEPLMRLIASPFFTYTIRVVRVERERIKFGWRSNVPIFHVYSITNKLPLWPADENWKPTQLVRIMCDSLYAHVELECKHAPQRVQECVRKVLSDIESFPLSLSKPSENSLPPSSVPLNNYSTRPDRTKYLSEFIVKPFKVGKNQAPVMFYETKPLLGCLRELVTPADFLLLDLEKPSTIWDIVVERLGVPVQVLSAATHWQHDRNDAVALKMAPFTRLADLNINMRSIPLDEYELRRMADNIRFSPSWFASWFGFARDRNNRKERLDLYALFAAVELWNQTLRDSERYGSVSTFLLTKAKREAIFDSDYIWIDDEYAASIRLAGNKDEGHEPRDPLTQEEKVHIMERMVEHFRAFNEAHKPSPFVVQSDNFSTLTSTAAIHAGRYRTSLSLAKLVLKVAMLFANVREKIVPRVLASISPLVVQCSSVFGKTSGVNASEFQSELRAACGSSIRILALSSYRVMADINSTIQKETQPHIIIFNDFHNWSQQQLSIVVDRLSQGDYLNKCTHLMILGYAHSLGFINGGGSMIWELMEVAEHIEENMGLNTTPASDEGMRASSLMASLRASQFETTDPMRGAARGAQFYTIDQRRAQLTANANALLYKESGEIPVACRSVLRRFELDGKCRVAFLAARFITLKKIKSTLSAQNYNLFNLQPPLFFYYTLHAVEADPLLIQNADYIVFADLDYKGAGRINYMHLNTAFENAKAVFFANDFDTNKYGKLSDWVDDIFMDNDHKSERHLLAVARCPILRNQFFEKYFVSSKLCEVLKFRSSSRIMASIKNKMQKEDEDGDTIMNDD